MQTDPFVVASALTLCAVVVGCKCSNSGQDAVEDKGRSRLSVTTSDSAKDPPGKVSVAGLFEQIVDLDRLMRPDVTPYTWRQVSSTNVQSDPKKPKSWYGDNQGHIRTEDGQRVIFESSKPGAIVRLWTTDPSGRIRIFIDGSKSPVIDEEIKGLVTGKTGPFKPPFAYVSAGGMNLIHPISWSRSVKLTVSSPKLFYTLDVREFDADTEVESYPGASTKALVRARDRAAAVLTGGFSDLSPTASYTLDSTDPAAEGVLAASKGGSVIRTTRLRLSSNDRAKLSRTALEVDVDGIRTIEIPMSAALAPMSDAAEVASLPLSSSGKDWILRLPIPFARTARIRLADRGGGQVTAKLDVAVEPMPVTDDTYRLFAAYLGPRSSDVSTWSAQVNVSSIRGKGRFVGLTYEVGNDDPRRQWWGEGDPIISVDDQPVVKGTGTEDHFLFAFCSTARFHSPFSGQTRANAGDNGGLITLYRFHTLDDIPFNSRFDMDFELVAWGTHHERIINLQTAAVSWFYGRPDAKFVGGTGGRKKFTPISLPEALVKPGTRSVTCGPAQ